MRHALQAWQQALSQRHAAEVGELQAQLHESVALLSEAEEQLRMRDEELTVLQEGLLTRDGSPPGGLCQAQQQLGLQLPFPTYVFTPPGYVVMPVWQRSRVWVLTAPQQACCTLPSHARTSSHPRSGGAQPAFAVHTAVFDS